MANKNYRTKKKRGANVVGIIALIVAAAVTVTTLGVGTSGFKDWSFSRFFPKSEVQEQQPDDEQPDGGKEDNTVITAGEENGLKLMTATISPENYAEYGISTLAESAFSLTVIITPSNATNKSVDIIGRWKNAQSEWASGKSVTDYLTINQTSDGSLTATGTVLQSFSEPIEIVATLRNQEEITATAQVNYVGYYSAEFNYGDPFSSLYDCAYLNDVKLLGGTIAPDSNNVFTVRAYLESWVIEAMEEKGYTMVSEFEFTRTLDLESFPWECEVNEPIDYYLGFGGLDRKDEKVDQYLTDLGKVMLRGQTAESKQGDYSNIQVEVFCNRVYNGETYESIEIDSRHDVDLTYWTDFVIPADGMSFDNSQIVVG